MNTSNFISFKAPSFKNGIQYKMWNNVSLISASMTSERCALLPAKADSERVMNGKWRLNPGITQRSCKTINIRWFIQWFLTASRVLCASFPHPRFRMSRLRSLKHNDLLRFAFSVCSGSYSPILIISMTHCLLWRACLWLAFTWPNSLIPALGSVYGRNDWFPLHTILSYLLYLSTH